MAFVATPCDSGVKVAQMNKKQFEKDVERCCPATKVITGPLYERLMIPQNKIRENV